MAMIKNFTDEPFFWPGYASDEEVASPMASDNLSCHSSESDNDSELVSLETAASLPSQFTQSCSKVEQCSRAQAVTLVPAGKAKVISMPRLVDVSAIPRMKRPAITPVRLPVPRMGRIEASTQSTFQIALPNSSEDTPVYKVSSPDAEQSQSFKGLRRKPSLPSSIIEQSTRVKSVRKEPSLPTLQSTAHSQLSTPYSSPHSVQHPQSADFLRFDPFPPSPLELPTTPMSPGRRRLHKLSSSIGLNNVFSKGPKRNDTCSSPFSEDLETVKESEPVLVTLSHQEMLTPTRKPNVRAKLVARGASEREPVLVLPPCSEDDDDNFTTLPS